MIALIAELAGSIRGGDEEESQGSLGFGKRDGPLGQQRTALNLHTGGSPAWKLNPLYQQKGRCLNHHLK
jgi:hypothetical protein